MVPSKSVMTMYLASLYFASSTIGWLMMACERGVGGEDGGCEV
jgi:hypothetical protein